MYRAEDYKAGKGIKPKKPSTSILPYLREMQAEEAKRTASPKPVENSVREQVEERATLTEESYNEARRSILAEG